MEFQWNGDTLIGDAPIMLTSGSFNPERGFLMRLAGSIGQGIELQTSRDLITWQAVTNLTLATEALDYLDADALKFPFRFYRAAVR
ncbi:MAG: hypothetical protein FJ403_23455 [Verrucomicrobia bacterium]|nr:hypothetical protein [Verrucomicrobiota bacterium]